MFLSTVFFRSESLGWIGLSLIPLSVASVSVYFVFMMACWIATLRMCPLRFRQSHSHSLANCEGSEVSEIKRAAAAKKSGASAVNPHWGHMSIDRNFSFRTTAYYLWKSLLSLSSIMAM